MISKELLSEVFGEEVDYVDESIVHKKEGHFLAIRFKNGNYYEMPLCWIAHKCKEWAFSQGIKLTTYMDDIDKWICTDKFNIILGGDFLSETESEAIFLACQYILDNLSNKKKDK